MHFTDRNRKVQTAQYLFALHRDVKVTNLKLIHYYSYGEIQKIQLKAEHLVRRRYEKKRDD
jgi:hypothetical protein